MPDYEAPGIFNFSLMGAFSIAYHALEVDLMPNSVHGFATYQNGMGLVVGRVARDGDGRWEN